MSYVGTNKIGKMYLGGTEIAKAYLGSNLVFQKGGGPAPGLVPYIRGGGNGSYIDTGITADNTTRVIVWARNFNPGVGSSGYTWFFGSRDAGMTNQFGVYGCITTRTGNIGGLYGGEFFYSGDAFKRMSHYHKYELDGNILKVDDEVVATATASTFSNENTICLFGIKSGGTVSVSALPIDICACKIYKGGVLVRDYTAFDDEQSVGLYDSVSETLFTNAGSGSLAYGEFNRSAYTPLEYITSSNNQWFDTGVLATYALPIVFKFRPTNTSGSWTGVFGVIKSSSPAESCSITLGRNGRNNCLIAGRMGPNSSGVNIYEQYSGNALTGRDFVISKMNNVLAAYENNALVGRERTFSGATSTFSTTLTMYVGGTRSGASSFVDNKFTGRIYIMGLGATANFVPAKVNGVAGMYDTYNDVFKPSESGTDFVAGPEL